MPRTPPPPTLRTFTFATGIAVAYQPITAFFLNRLRVLATRQCRASAPSVPTIATDFGQAPSPADPAYLAALATHQQTIGIRMFQLAVAFAVHIDPALVAEGLAAYDAEAQRWAAFAATHGADDDADAPTDAPDLFARYLDGVADDVTRYVLLVASGGDELELVRLMQALYLSGHIDEEAVAAATDSFKSDVSGHGHLEAASADVGGVDPQSGAGVDLRGLGEPPHDREL